MPREQARILIVVVGWVSLTALVVGLYFARQQGTSADCLTHPPILRV